MIHTYSTTIRRKEMDAVLTCMVDEKIGPGELNTRFIQQVKDFFKCDGAVALRSPAIALQYALKALEIESGSKITVSALAPAWQYQVLNQLGFNPVVLDVEESNGLVSFETLEKAVTEGAKLIILNESEGIVPDLNKIISLGVPVIEDISQSAGAMYSVLDDSGVEIERKRVGLAGIYSFIGLEERDVLTSGGGAVLMAPGRKEWISLKKYVDNAPITDFLPDINSALALVQLKEFVRNETTRKEIYNLYQHASMIGKHKLLARDLDDGSTMYSFPLVLNSPFKDVKQFASKKEIEIQLAFENSIIAYKEELSESCIHAKSLLLRCAHFPLYPRLTHSETAKIVKVLGSLP